MRPHWPSDVLDLLLAHVLEREIELVSHLLVRCQPALDLLAAHPFNGPEGTLLRRVCRNLFERERLHAGDGGRIGIVENAGDGENADLAPDALGGDAAAFLGAHDVAHQRPGRIGDKDATRIGGRFDPRREVSPRRR